LTSTEKEVDSDPHRLGGGGKRKKKGERPATKEGKDTDFLGLLARGVQLIDGKREKGSRGISVALQLRGKERGKKSVPNDFADGGSQKGRARPINSRPEGQGGKRKKKRPLRGKSIEGGKKKGRGKI